MSYDATGEESSTEATTNDDSALEENIQAREHEISNLIQEEEEEEAEIDQSRQPKNGDIVKFLLNK